MHHRTPIGALFHAIRSVGRCRTRGWVFLVLVVCVLGRASLQAQSPAAPSREPAPGRPNILILLADDLGVEAVGAYGVGVDPPSTPNIDGLASRGVVFRNAWSNPSCSPSRATIQTGRYCFRNGVGNANTGTQGLTKSEVTLAEMIKLGSGGEYSAAAIGKWHLGGDPSDRLQAPFLQGYDLYEGSFAGTAGNYFDWWKITNRGGLLDRSRVTEYATTHHVNNSLEWISEQQGPWLCYLAFNNPHAPWHAPPAALHGVDLSSAGAPKEDSHPYFKAMVEAMDTEIGRLLSTLDGMEIDAQGRSLLDRTTVFFIGDNGTPPDAITAPFDAEHAKATLYQGGVHVPFIVSGPQVSLPGESQALVSTADVFTTVAQIAGIDLAAVLAEDYPLDSVGLLPYLRDTATPSQRAVLLTEAFSPNGAGMGLRTCPPTTQVCQPDLGHAGPGNAVLSVCGQPLYLLNEARLELTDVPPNAKGFLYISHAFKPTDMLGGTITPQPVRVRRDIVTTSQGDFVIESLSLAEFFGYAHSRDQMVYVQCAIEDASQEHGYVISNTVQMQLKGYNVKAVRDERYKLIWDLTGDLEEFYDLFADPYEHDDLMPELNEAEAEHHRRLKAAILEIVDPSLPGACLPK